MNNWEGISKVWINLVDHVFLYGMNVLAAAFILIVGYLSGRLLDRFVVGVAKRSGLESLFERLELPKLLYRVGIHSSVATALGRAVRWAAYLMAAFVAVDTLGIEAFSTLRDQFISYLPRLISSIAMLLAGLVLADFIRTLIVNALADNALIENPDFVGKFSYVLVMLVTFSLALEQAGLEMALVRNLLLISLAAVGLAFAISLGFSSQQVVKNLIARPYVERMLKLDDRVTLDEKAVGMVKTFAAQSVVLILDGHEVLIPYSNFLEQTIGITNLRDDTSLE